MNKQDWAIAICMGFMILVLIGVFIEFKSLEKDSIKCISNPLVYAEQQINIKSSVPIYCSCTEKKNTYNFPNFNVS